MDIPKFPTDEQEIKKYKQKMQEAGIDEIEIEYPAPGYYDHPVGPYVKTIKYRSTGLTADEATIEKFARADLHSNEQQRLYVQRVYDYFREKETWPTYREIDEQLIQIDRKLDIEEIVKDLPSGFGNLLAHNYKYGEKGVLSIAAIQQCKNSQEDLENFIKAIRLFADMHFKKAVVTDLTVTGADLWRELNMPESSIRKVGELIKGESWLYIGSEVDRVDGFGATWQYILTREIRKFDGILSIDEYLERRDKPNSRTISSADQVKSLLGYMYRKPGSEDAISGIETWAKNLTEPNEKTGTKLEVALLNALTRLGVPALFGGDIEWTQPITGEKEHSGPQTPIFDLVALNFGAPMRGPTAVLISCKSTRNQPKDIEIRLLSDESQKVRKLLPGWQVFGELVNLDEPTADDFQERNDVRIWKHSDLQVLFQARDSKYIAQFLWTPPWHWKRGVEITWRSMFNAYHKDLYADE